MTDIWEEVVEEGIVTEKGSRATELIIILFILAIIAFVVGCLISISPPSEIACEDALFDIGVGIRTRRPAPTFDDSNAQGGGASKPTDNGAPERAKPPILIVTAYCQNSCCCGIYADGITASGHIIEPNDCFVAAPPWMPFGTRLSIPGYAGGRMVSVEDRGGKIKGNKIDIFYETHKEALEWGVKYLKVRIEK